MKYPIRKTIKKIGNSYWFLIPSYFFEQQILEEGQEIKVIIDTTTELDEVDLDEQSDNRTNNNQRS